MWKSVLTGIVLENIETLKHYQAMKDENGCVVKGISLFVSNVIMNLPWYFRVPVIALAIITGLLCILTTGSSLALLSPEKRSSFLRRVRAVPFWGMLNKLVRSMAFMKLFDSIPPAPENLNGLNLERN
jgi:hypothetical protein